MAAAAARTPLYSSQVIDLTQSDDEETSQLQRNAIRPQAPDFVSHDGLITEETFQYDGRQKSYQRGSAILPWHGSQSLGVSPRIGVSLPTDGTRSKPGHNAMYRRTTDQSSSAGGAIIRPILPPPAKSDNPVKRRKTHGGMIPQQQRVTPILPPTSRNQTHTRGTVSERYRPAPQKASSAVASTIITGASRAESSRSTPKVSPGASIHKLADDGDTQMKDCLNNQVFEHIREPLQQYHHSLPPKVRKSIGSKIAQQLISDPEFYNDFTANDGKISKEYEKKNLAKKAQAYINRYATEALEGRNRSRAASSRPTSQIASDLERPQRGRYPLPSTFNGREASTSPDASSISEDNVFEEHQRRAPQRSIPSFTGLSRTYSSSPTTSFSNDHTDGEKTEDGPRRTGDADATHQLRRSGRSINRPTKPATSQVPAKIKQPPASNTKPKPKPKTKPNLEKNNEPQLPKPDINVIHEIQSLRFAARDRSLPRPYISHNDREDIQRGLQSSHLSYKEREMLEASIIHVDFSIEEIKIVCVVIRYLRGDRVSRIRLSPDLHMQVMSLISGWESSIPRIQRDIRKALNHSGDDTGTVFLRKRSDDAISAFLEDAAAGKVASTPQLVRLESQPRGRTGPPKSPFTALLRQREIWGMTPHRIRRGQDSFRAMVNNHFEDSLTRQSEWTDCCGDIAAISWTSKNAFLCGATAHSDFHNMQYNKPGNLLIGSSSLDTLKAVADHRIVRPIVCKGENAENALESMRQTQDPWLYTSVVSTAHSGSSGFTFTASFDGTVKAWKVSENGSHMDLHGTWPHDGKVNFVVTSEYHDRVATASDVSVDAVRVYNFDEDDVQGSAYDAYCGNRAQEQGVDLRRREDWAYFPATIQWGKSPGVRHMLLVGYSPRSLTSHEIDIPEDKRNTGELCLWNVDDGSRVTISSARTQNVFEVLWHPTQPIFLAATSPCGTFEPSETKTQIRLFAQNELGAFMHIKALDCPAFDINELTIMPNSTIQCYVTASCTDGNTYVWDTAQGDQAVHILQHGDSLDNPIHELPLELADTGVKFASWGQSVNRFYTGASDGKVKAWDITRQPGDAFVRNVLTVTGGISAGSFSKDFTQLVIGDATGKVHLLKIDDCDVDDEVAQPAKPLPGRRALEQGGLLPNAVKRPKVVIPHPEPPPPDSFAIEADQTGQELAQIYVEEGQLRVHPDPGVGAIRGPNYLETGLFRLEAHEEYDGSQPLLPEWQAKQQSEILEQRGEIRLPRLPRVQSSDLTAHEENLSLDLDFSKLSLSALEELKRDRCELHWENNHKFKYELFPSHKLGIFKHDRVGRESRLESSEMQE